MLQQMGDLEALIAGIRRRAEQRAIDGEARAGRRAEEILSQSDGQAAQAALEVRRKGDKEVEALRQRLLAQGQLELQRRFLEVRETLLERVWQDAERHLRELVESNGLAQTFEGLAGLAAKELGPGLITLEADPRSHGLLTEERLAAWGRPAGVVFVRGETPADTWGGFLAQRDRTRFDATFPARLELARQVLRAQVFAQLDGVATPAEEAGEGGEQEPSGGRS